MKLTPAQQTLLDEIERNAVRGKGGGLYIRRYSRYWRTICALERRGLVRCDDHDHSTLGQDHWVPTWKRDPPKP